MSQARRRRSHAASLALLLLLVMPAAGGAQEPSPSPAPAGGELGADTIVLQEPFESPADWMGLGQFRDGRNELQDGVLFTSITVATKDGGNVWTVQRLEEASPVVRVEVDVAVVPGDRGAAGPACGSAAGLDRLFVAGVNDGGWFLGRLIDGRLQVIDEGELIGSSGRETHHVALECASAPEEGGDYMTMSVDGRLVDVDLPRLDIPVGPYGQVALLVGTDGSKGRATFDDLVVSVGDTYLPADPERDPDAPSAGIAVLYSAGDSGRSWPSAAPMPDRQMGYRIGEGLA